MYDSTSPNNGSALEKAIGWALSVDGPAIQAEVTGLRSEQPEASPEELARNLFARQSWKAAAVGFGSGLPANLAAAIPLAIVDAATVLRLEVVAAAKVATIYEPGFLDNPEAPWELLLPIFGADVASQALKEMGVQGGKQVTKQVIRKYLSKETLKAFERFMLKYFGMKVTQKGVLTKTLPVVGGLIGGIWNLVEVRLLGNRVIAYFEGRALS